MNNPVLPLKDAVERISAKTPIGSVLKSADWEKVPLMLRERAQFSAGVTSMRVLQAIQDRIASQVKQQRENLANGKQATFDRSSFIDSIRSIAREEGLTPTDESKAGGLQDITSIPRLGLIYDTQNAMAAGYAQWKLDQNEGALALYPAYRFGPSSARVPRATWLDRWARAGSAVGWEGTSKTEMVALKTSPIWAALSRFGTPWPPFDFGSTRELEDVDHDAAVELGLLKPGEVPSGGEESFNENLQASVEGIDPQKQSMLQKFFGDQIEIEDGTARWAGNTARKDFGSPDEVPEMEFAKPVEALDLPDVIKPTGDSDPASDLVRPISRQFAAEESRLSKISTHEEATAFMPSGLALFKTTQGTKSQIRISRENARAMRASGEIVLAHNHPEGRSFSIADLQAASDWNLKGLVAVGVKGDYTYYLKRPMDGWPSKDAIDKAYLEAKQLETARSVALIRAGKATPEQLSDPISYRHNIIATIARNLNLSYERRQR